MHPSHRLIATASLLVLAGCQSRPEVVFEAPPAPSVDAASSEAVSSVAVSQASVASAATSIAPTPSSKAPSSIAGSVLIKVPFGAQAPFADWGDPYQEACEEAALIMAQHFLSGEPLTPELTDRAILEIVAWETDHGYGQDVNIEELAVIAREFYGLHAQVHTDVSIDRIKQLIATGQPVIIPAAGRMLGNPYFSGEGPFYHMLIIVGYDEDEFITNDPGTRRGEGYRYDQQVLLDAIHDWTGIKEETHTGRKVMLTVR